MMKKTESWSEMEKHLLAVDRLRREFDDYVKKTDDRIKILEEKLERNEKKSSKALERFESE